MTTETVRDLFESRDKLLEQLRKENASLREQIRLTNDKMAEQVRQALYEVASATQEMSPAEAYEYMADIRDANAPKD